MIFREEHHTTTVSLSLYDHLQVDLAIVPGSDRQWVIVASTVASGEGLRLVESYRYSSATNQKKTWDRQRLRWQPLAVGSFPLELHYKSLGETECAQQFVLHLRVESA